jgi:hypothetical protein
MLTDELLGPSNEFDYSLMFKILGIDETEQV